MVMVVVVQLIHDIQQMEESEMEKNPPLWVWADHPPSSPSFVKAGGTPPWPFTRRETQQRARERESKLCHESI